MEPRSHCRILFLQELPIPRPAVMQLVAVLRQAGHACAVMVATLEKQLAREAVRWRPDLIALSCMTGEHLQVLRSVAGVRAALPDVPVVMGGPHPTCWPDVVQHPAVDIICRGEGEEAIVELAGRIAANEPYEEIANLVVKTGGGLRRNPLRPLIHDLERLPAWDRDIYGRYSAGRLDVHHPLVLTGRGCPFSCSYCINQFVRTLYGVRPGEHVRRRSPEAVLDELEGLVARYPVRVVEFIDDTFTLNRPWLRTFLPAYARRIGRPFACDVRADTLSPELMAALRQAGCVTVRLGVESGSDRVREQILGKQLARRTIVEAARTVRESGARLMTYNIVGAPGETLDDALQTLQLNRELRPDYALCSLLQPYPGTAVRRRAREQGLLADDGDIDRFPSALYTVSLLSNPDRQGLEGLQRLFDLLVRVPLPLAVVRRLAALGPSLLHDLLFKASYAGYLRGIERFTLGDLIRAGLVSHGQLVNRHRP
jgi:anaerobic magnesium-protoporphyrin IX monomethyl ester cyclase